MKRIVLLTTLAAMMAAAMALSGVAQTKPITNTKADTKCLVEAAKTVEQPGFKPANYTFHGGTEGNDFNFQGDAEGNDVFCGFGGDDEKNALLEGDIFLGGAGNDSVRDRNHGTVNGGEGDDIVDINFGTFDGGDG
jgi:Ca2+-binding RTX toxin-like protein